MCGPNLTGLRDIQITSSISYTLVTTKDQFFWVGIILTKDNFAKRNWHGASRCVFCHRDETIKHLFFQCRFSRSIWSIIQVASNLYPLTSVANIFGNWLH
jgi:hypothetical protein